MRDAMIAAQESLLSTADAGGLTQPWATIVASLFALTAAGIAYAGVLKTTGTTKQQALRKENFDREEARRKEKSEVLLEALAAIRSATRLLILLDRQVGAAKRENFTITNAAAHEDLQSAGSLSTAKLMLYGFATITEPMSAQLVLCSEQWRAVAADPSHIVDKDALTSGIRMTLEAFEAAFGTLEKPQDLPSIASRPWWQARQKSSPPAEVSANGT